jgi:hypothetical protein
LRVVRVDRLSLERRLPGVFVADGPFALNRHARLRGEVRAWESETLATRRRHIKTKRTGQGGIKNRCMSCLLSAQHVPASSDGRTRLTGQRALVGWALLAGSDVRNTDLGDIDVGQRSSRLSVSGRDGAASGKGGLV